MEECATAAIAVLDALDVTEPADWVGNAWGGHVGLVAAADTPDRCRTVVTIGTPTQALTRRNAPGSCRWCGPTASPDRFHR